MSTSSAIEQYEVDDADAWCNLVAYGGGVVGNMTYSKIGCYQHALKLCGCKTIPIPSIPPSVPKAIARVLNLRSFPPYLMAFFKYPVVIDGRAFAREFGFEPKRPLKEIFRYYRDNKKPV